MHFHDVFTGSHPEKVYLDVLSRLQKSRALADSAMNKIFASNNGNCIRVVNSLPFARSEWLCLPGEFTIEGTPCYTSGGRSWFRADVDAFASKIYTPTSKSSPDH